MYKTVVDLMRQAEQTFPTRIASEDLSGRTLTLDDVRRRSNRLAHGLRAAGLEPGNGVMFLGRNCIEYPEIDFGIAKAGLTRVPLYHQLSSRDIARAVELTGARAVIADAEAIARGRLEPVLEHFDVRLALGGEVPGWSGYDDWLSRGADTDLPPLTDPETAYHVRLTSGSSGTPKGIVVSHRAARAAILGNTSVLHREADEARPRTLQQAPVTLASGWTVLPTLLSGGTNVFVGKFDAERAVETLVETGTTWTFVVPTMLRMLAAAGTLDQLKGSSLSALVYGGEPPPADTMAELTAVTYSLVQCYGQTEAPSWTLVLSRRDHADSSLWSSAGRSIPGVQVGVADEAGQVSTEVGASGEMVLRGANVCSAILGAPQEYARRLLADGWWRTGDNAELHPDGHVFLVGRQSEMIIRGGSNVHPSEIEAALSAHPDVREASVVGVPHRVWGEVPVALVSSSRLAGETGEAQLLEWAAQRLAAPKRPVRVYLQHQDLPRLDADAKVSRPMVREVVLQLMPTNTDE